MNSSRGGGSGRRRIRRGPEDSGRRRDLGARPPRAIPPKVFLWATLGAVGVFIGTAAITLSTARPPAYARSAPTGTNFEWVDARQHLDGPTDYRKNPPVGGNHSPHPFPCGVYFAPIPTERAVHSLEHGAVWITHADASPTDLRRLAQLAARHTKVLVSPLTSQASPFVATAWTLQLELSTSDDPRLGEFIDNLERSPQAPEPDGGC